MRRANVIGLGWVSPGGMGPGSAAPGFATAGSLPEIARRDLFVEVDRRFGRLDAFSRLGLAAVTFALRDADLEQWQEKRPIGVIAATRFGCLATDVDYFDTVIPEQGKMASPNLFAYTLPNSFLGEVALRFGLTGTSFIVSGDASGCLAPLHLALESLALGDEEVILAGCCDLPLPAGISLPAAEPAGALFAVLTRNAGTGYGTLLQDESGALHFAGAPLAAWRGLAERARRPQDP